MPHDHYDVIIVGSGFGGSTMAYRLAREGLSVLVLERGKAYPPRSFPRSPYQMKDAFWDPSEGLHGMFNLWWFTRCSALVSSGLGGGSLIYANVLLRKDEKWFATRQPDGKYKEWPVTRKDLEPHYDSVQARIGTQTYPFGHAPYDSTPKTLAMRDAAATLHREHLFPPLAITFSNPNGSPVQGEPIVEVPGRVNIHGTIRDTCRRCGECDVGCNYGSKNTLDHTLLSDAKTLGADIRTSCEVKTFAKTASGFEVKYVQHAPPRPSSKNDVPLTVTSDRLVLSAGTFGSTYLLFRHFPRKPDALGTRFSLNGDLLGFIRDCHDSKTGQKRILDAGLGPVITSAIRFGDELDGHGDKGPGFYIEDGGYPDYFNWIVDPTLDLTGTLSRGFVFARRLLRAILDIDPNRDLSSSIANLFGSKQSRYSLPILAMGRDVPDGDIFMAKKEYLDVHWSNRGSSPYYRKLRRSLKQMARSLDGQYRDNHALRWFKQAFTAHPLGGCPIGTSARDGVVDVFGQVFEYPGLYIADGSVLPGPVGPNPSLTIAALADRFAAHLADEFRASRSFGAASPGSISEPAQVTNHDVRLSFTEEMKGYIALGETDPHRGDQAGRAANTTCMFHLTITANEVGRFLADPDRVAAAMGYIECAILGGRLPVEDGRFNLLVNDASPTSKRMVYNLQFEDATGAYRTLVGRKIVEDGPGNDIWQDTTTLFVRIFDGHVVSSATGEIAGGTVVAAGILRIHFFDFMHQMTTFRVEAHTIEERFTALSHFGKIFLGQLWDVYGDLMGSPEK